MSTLSFPTRAALIAATIPADVLHVFVSGVGEYRKDNSSANPAATSNSGGTKWIPADRYTVKHYGALGDNTTNDRAAVQLAITASASKTLHFPPGTYLISPALSLPSYSHWVGENTATLKVFPGDYPSGTLLCVATGVGNTNFLFENLIFDGNKGNVGAATLPIFTLYLSKKATFRNCTFQNTQGIALNVSTSTDDFTVEGCKFVDVGRNPDGSEGTRTQAIAFSNAVSGTVTRTNRVRITGNTFLRVGLDCISPSNVTDLVIADNICMDSYTFVYGGVLPGYCQNVSITGNVIYNITQGTLVSSSPPVAVDLPSVLNCTIVGNSFDTLAAAAIGIFGGARNVVVASNMIRNAGLHSQYQDMPWQGAIAVGGAGAGASGIENVQVTYNTIVDTLSQLRWGILLRNDLINCYVAGNIVNAGTQGKYGRYLANTTPSNANTTPIVDTTSVSATTIIQAVDFSTPYVDV